MKSLFCLPAVAVCLFSSCAFAGVSYRQTKIADAPFDMPVLNEPVFPNRDFIISDFGASSDGKKCTEAIAKAMEACSAAGGGRVVVPAGRWLTGAVHFRSNCNLHLAEGAVLEFSDDPADYPLVQATWGGIECMNHSPLLYAFGVEDIAITGKGRIAPRMKRWQDWFSRPPEHMKAIECLYHWGATNAPVAFRNLPAIKGSNMRPQLIHLNRARNVLLDGFEIRESPLWTIHLFHSENCIIRNLDSRARGHNNDGIDIEMTRNVLVEKCVFDQQDDGVCLKAGRNQDAWRLNRPTENVVVRDCHFIGAHTMLGIGSELSGGIRNVWMTRCTATAVLSPLLIKTNHRRGGFVENIWFDNCRAGDVSTVFAIWSRCFYQWARFPDYEVRYTKIRNINMDGFSCERAYRGLVLKGDSHEEPCGISVKNVKVGNVMDGFVDIQCCNGVNLEGVKIEKKDPDVRWAFVKQLPVSSQIAELSPGHARAAEFLSKKKWAALPDGEHDLGDGAVAFVGIQELRPCNEAKMSENPDFDMFVAIPNPENSADSYVAEWFYFGKNRFPKSMVLDCYAFIPAKMQYADKLVFGNAQMRRRVVVKVKAAAR